MKASTTCLALLTAALLCPRPLPAQERCVTTVAENGATASGPGAIACGLASKAGQYATALGMHADAGTDSGTAVGTAASAARNGSALGLWANAGGEAATAVGRQASASASYAVAQGAHASASGLYAVAQGTHSTAPGYGAVAQGASAEAGATMAVALGANARADRPYTVSVGDAGGGADHPAFLRAIANVGNARHVNDAVSVAFLIRYLEQVLQVDLPDDPWELQAGELPPSGTNPPDPR